MLFTFRQSENAEGCLMWGKVLSSRGKNPGPPVKVTRSDNGTESSTFQMNYYAEKIDGSWDFRHATVRVHCDPTDTIGMKLSAMVRLLRPNDPVLIIGRHSSRSTTGPRSGKTVTTHYVEAFAVIPMAWLCDIFSELFEDIVETSAVPKSRKRSFSKSRIAPEKTEEDEEIAPAANDMGGWFD